MRVKAFGFAIGAVVVLIAGCCFIGKFFGDDDEPAANRGNTRGGTGTSTATPGSDKTSPPAAPPVSPEEYQTKLAAADAALGQPFKNIGAARTPAALKTAATALEQSLQAQFDALSDITPPKAAEQQHLTLVEGLRQLTASAENVATSAGRLSLCTGASAMVDLTAAPGAVKIRAAAKDLATVDTAKAYKFGVFLPAPVAKANRRLANGAYVKRTTGGSGRLEITNGGGDATISLVPNGGKNAVTTVYVRGGGNKFTVTGIKTGTYRIYMSSGEDWDNGAKAFTRSCGFQQFDDTFAFSSTNGWRITLTPVVGGNASTSDGAPGNFPG
jgi:hypothetical protein